MKISKLLLFLFFTSVIIKLAIIYIATPQYLFLDDGYYYMQIARNVVYNHSLSLDGINITNGFQPLWMFFLIPLMFITKIFSLGNIFPMYGSLIISSIFSIMTGFYIFKILDYFEFKKWAVFSVFIYLFLPSNIIETLNGLETAFSSFFFVYVLYFYFTKIRSKNLYNFSNKLSNNFSNKHSSLNIFEDKFPMMTIFIFGIICGLCILARLDNLYLIFAIGIDWIIFNLYINYASNDNSDSLIKKYKHGNEKMYEKKHIRIWNALKKITIKDKLFFAIGLFIIIMPFILFNISIHKYSLDSSRANRMQSLAVAYISYPGLISDGLDAPNARFYILTSITHLKFLTHQTIFSPLMLVDETLRLFIVNIYSVFFTLMLFVLLIAAYFYNIYKNKHSNDTSELFSKTYFLWIYILIMFCFYSFYQFAPWFSYRYMVNAGISFFIIFGLVMENLLRKKKWWILSLYVISFIFISFFSNWTTAVSENAQIADNYTAQNSIIGAPQAGAMAYLSHRTVINLDGKLNEEANLAFKNRTMDEYICSHNINYVIDGEPIVESNILKRSKRSDYLRLLETKNTSKGVTLSIYLVECK